jgi:hypothetical protein
MRAQNVPQTLGLGVPFAVIGFAGSLLAAEFFKAGCFEHDTTWRVLLLVTAVPAAALLGKALDVCIQRWPFGLTMVACVVGTACLSVFCGAFVGGVEWPPSGVRAGACDGFAASAAFAPAFGATLLAAHRATFPRAGSMVAASRRMAVWRAVACSISLGTLAALPQLNRYAACPPAQSTIGLAFAVVAVLAAAVLALGDAHRFERAAALARDAIRERPVYASDARAFGAAYVDLGVGEALREVPVSGSTAYRDLAPPVRVLRGDPVDARRLLGFAMMRSAIAFALASASLGVQLALT